MASHLQCTYVAWQSDTRASLLWKGYNLEHQHGTARFGVAVASLLVLSQALVVVVAFVLATLFHIHVRLQRAYSIYRSRTRW